ncbi:MAG: efflux transporter periplasmic adaptor subunit, partial [Muribaculaceae bacterium]|nr:efflux transporter periplasmic adaptor subunit [Muribaculaceae bacterium]
LGADSGKSGALYRNMPLTFQTALPHSYTADLYYVAPSVNTSTGSLELVGNVRNIDNELKDGMYVTVSLPYGTNPKAVIVKDAALSTDQLGKYLYVVNDSDKVVYTPVTVGPLYRDSLRVIEKGIKAGDRYVTEALLTVRNGMKVKPVLK